jgi:hypothetical protein
MSGSDRTRMTSSARVICLFGGSYSGHRKFGCALL